MSSMFTKKLCERSHVWLFSDRFLPAVAIAFIITPAHKIYCTFLCMSAKLMPSLKKPLFPHCPPAMNLQQEALGANELRKVFLLTFAEERQIKSNILLKVSLWSWTHTVPSNTSPSAQQYSRMRAINWGLESPEDWTSMFREAAQLSLRHIQFRQLSSFGNKLSWK